jgi:hypothetical protein
LDGSTFHGFPAVAQPALVLDGKLVICAFSGVWRQKLASWPEQVLRQGTNDKPIVDLGEKEMKRRGEKEKKSTKKKKKKNKKEKKRDRVKKKKKKVFYC